MNRMRIFPVLAAAFCFSVLASDRVDEIKWLTAKDAFEKAQSKDAPRWVLLYKVWPR